MSEFSLRKPGRTIPYSRYHKEIQEKALRGDLSELHLNDFRLSFRYSGSETNQYLLFFLMGLQYYHAGSVVQEAVHDSLAVIPEETWKKKARPPKIHLTVDDEHLEREAKNESSKFKATILPERITEVVADMQPDYIASYGDLLCDLAYRMVRSDLRHLSGLGRPGRTSTKGRFASFFHDYVLCGLPAGSPTFNAIFEDVRQQTVEHPPTELSVLARYWQLHHEADFYPEAFLEDASSRDTSSLFYYEGPAQYRDRRHALLSVPLLSTHESAATLRPTAFSVGATALQYESTVG